MTTSETMVASLANKISSDNTATKGDEIVFNKSKNDNDNIAVPVAVPVGVGIHGVRLKRFEKVVAKLLSSVEPQYVRLPPPPPSMLLASNKFKFFTTPNTTDEGNSSNNDIDDDDDDWLFSALPQSARVVGNHPHRKRAQKKEGQLRSMLRCILQLVPPPPPLSNDSASSSIADNTSPNNNHIQSATNSSTSSTPQSQLPIATAIPIPIATTTRPITIVDFGGGSGHLGIPLALLLPNCRIVVVDFNERSIDLLHEKAAGIIREIESEGDSKQRQHNYARFSAKTTPAMVSSSSSLLRCCGSNGNGIDNGIRNDSINNDDDSGAIKESNRILGNLFTFAGPVEDFEEDFDVALALHLCGQATDVCLRKAVLQKVAAIVVAPCCVGKLSTETFNPDVYHATGRNNATVRYPQSALFCRVLESDKSDSNSNSKSNDKKNSNTKEEDWNALAKAADYSNEHEFRTSRNASRRTAKALLETDRRLFLETNRYLTALTKMKPLEVTPKNDILVAWRPELYREVETDPKTLFCTPDAECLADIEVAKSHLLLSSIPTTVDTADSATDSNADSNTTTNTNNKTSTNTILQSQGVRNDWTEQEEDEIKKSITDFLERTNTDTDSKKEVLVFPSRMGGRKRKLIHYIAEKLNLAHWGQGKKDSEKTVAVARRRQRKKLIDCETQ